MRVRILLLAFACLVCAALPATTVVKVTLSDAVALSTAIIHGRVVRSWASWDPDHTAIWTHYQIRVFQTLKGAGGRVLTVSEPGGEADGKHMNVVGAPRYQVGEEVVVFAASTPIGYLRTCGWGQGKFQVQRESGAPSGRVVRSGAAGIQLVDGPKRSAGALQSVASYDGADLSSFLAKVRDEVAAGTARGAK